MSDPMNLDSLNENQRRAVEWTVGPLLVLAGPGSGKTRVLTIRIGKILAETPGKPFRVLGLTFTNKAADEMRERLAAIAPGAAERALLTTFHAFCADVLRQHGSHVGIRPDFSILNQTADQIGVTVEVIRRLAPDAANPGTLAESYLPRIQECLEAFCAVEDIPGRYKKPEFGNNVRLLYQGYRQELVKRNALDFPSLLFLTHELLTAKSAVAKQLRIIYPHICVDEFQDTNLAQYTVLRQVVGNDPKNLFVVADDDQIIYQWNGASPERLHQIRADYNMAVIQLPTNYRCPAAVIDLANNLIRNNVDRAVDKQPLVAHKAPCDDTPICLQRINTQEEEVAWVTEHIRARGRAQWGHCAVLARARWLLEAVVKALADLDVPAVISVRKAEFETPPFQWLHAALRLANNRQDREQLRRVRKAFYEIEGLDIDLPLPDAEEAQPGADLLRDWVAQALSRRELEIWTRDFLTRILPMTSGEFDLDRFISESLTWFAAALRRADIAFREAFEDYEEELATWQELLRSTRAKYAGDGNGVSLPVLLQEFDLCTNKTPSAPPDAVRCFTVHAAKGMEFDHVYVSGLAEGVFPSWQSVEEGDQSPELREERRNCFVAITRTQTSLTLTYASSYRGRKKEASRFLAEMGLMA
jgi:DNA helicase-2/ATP-dependent DNA helicase PcrA